MAVAQLPRRIAVLSIHTSPLAAPGVGDAGGMNVYIRETSNRLADAGVGVDIYTRATNPDAPPIVEPRPGVRVLHIPVCASELKKEDLPGQMVSMAVAVEDLAEQIGAEYDLVHSHYWLSGQVGSAAAKRWRVPLVHTMHTMAKVKNLALAAGDTPEPALRVVGEERVVGAAARLVANTHREAAELIEHYDAIPERVSVVHPGVDLSVFHPGGGRSAARAALGWRENDQVILFVGRLQPLKAPDVLLRALRHLPANTPAGGHTRLVICGGPSGNGAHMLEALNELAHRLHLVHRVTFLPPQQPAELAELYRAADVVAVPSYSESFGLVAVEAQACGTPVVAAAVGGLVTAVKAGVSGLLVPSHDPLVWSHSLHQLLADAEGREQLSRSALVHARRFSWERTSHELLHVYQQVLGEQAVLATLERNEPARD